MQRLLNIRNTCVRTFPSTLQVPTSRLFNSRRPSSTYLNISRWSDSVVSLEKRKYHTSPWSSAEDPSKLEVNNAPHESSKINESSSVDDVIKWAEQFVEREDALKLKAQKINGKALRDLDALSLERWGIPGGPASILANEIVKLKGLAQKPQTLKDLKCHLLAKNIIFKLPRPAGEYTQWNNPPSDKQQQALGPLFLRPWPVITPINFDEKHPYIMFNFLYANSQIGEDNRRNLLEILRDFNTKIVINMGLSGAGKTHLLTQLGLQGEYWVILYDCGSNARVIGNMIMDYRRNHKLTSFEQYQQFSVDIMLWITTFQLSHIYTLHQLLTEGSLENPGQFLRYLENGGQDDIYQLFVVFQELMNSVVTTMRLKHQVLAEIAKLSKIPVIEAWDEAGLLTQWAAGMVPFSNHPGNPQTKFDSTTSSLSNAGSAFTVTCRIARENRTKTIFCGTGLRLGNVEADISKDLMKRVKITTDDPNVTILKSWRRDTVVKSLREDLQLTDVPSKVLDTISHVLQGRPRLTTLFKCVLYKMSQEGNGQSKELLLMRSLGATENEATRNFIDNIRKFVLGPTLKDLPERVQLREKLMKELVLKGFLDLDTSSEYDLVDAGIIHLQSYESGKARYRPLEPLMLYALYNYLLEQGYDYNYLLTEWMQRLLDNSWSTGKVGEQKGLVAEVLLAIVLNMVAKELNGQPITDHPLFVDQKGTFLDHYTLKATTFQHDDPDDLETGNLWADIMVRRRTDLLVIPPHCMGPDLFGLLSCLPNTPSYEHWNSHVIPLTAGVKVRSSTNVSKLSDDYYNNFLTTDPWAIFSRKGKIVDNEQHKKAVALLKETFPCNKRAVRISFTYKPHGLEFPSQNDQLHLVFDFHHTAFEEVLKRNLPEVANILKKFTRQS